MESSRQIQREIHMGADLVLRDPAKARIDALERELAALKAA